MTLPTDFVEVPVTLGFDSAKPIGVLTIRRDSLPPTADFVFALGFMAKSRGAIDLPQLDGPYLGPYELVQVGLVPDVGYIEYLRKIGKLPPSTGP